MKKKNVLKKHLKCFLMDSWGTLTRLRNVNANG